MIGQSVRRLAAALRAARTTVDPTTAAQVSAMAISCEALIAECTRLRVENETLRQVARENAILASYHRTACALQGIEPVTGERLQ